MTTAMKEDRIMFERNDHHELEAREKAELATEQTRPGLVFRPDVDILEESDAYIIHADMPGASEKTIEIDLDQGVLTLNARAENPVAEDDEERTLHSEYRSGGYHREFRVSEDIDSASVSASMKDGVLELRLPKSAQSRPRRISVAAA
jgi:HSP20 family molecular chaperone IbpA